MHVRLQDQQAPTADCHAYAYIQGSTMLRNAVLRRTDVSALGEVLADDRNAQADRVQRLTFIDTTDRVDASFARVRREQPENVQWVADGRRHSAAARHSVPRNSVDQERDTKKYDVSCR